MLKKLSKNKFFKIIFVNLIYLSLSLIRKTSNWSGINEEIIEKQLRDNKSIIVLIWHNQLMGSTFSWKFKPKLRPVATSHRDGQISTLVQRKFGLDPLLREKDRPTALIKDISLAVKNGECIYITPDAPHGPPYQINTNIYKLARKFDLKIALLTFKTNRFFRLNNWDKLKIPLPFSKGIYFWGKEIINPSHFDENSLNKFIIENLNKNLKIIDAYF